MPSCVSRHGAHFLNDVDHHYRYVNGGPGALGGIFVHKNYHGDKSLVKLGGWWAQKVSSRFAFPVVDSFDPVEGAAGWQASNPPTLLLASLSAALDIWSEAGPQRIAKKAELLTTCGAHSLVSRIRFCETIFKLSVVAVIAL